VTEPDPPFVETVRIQNFGCARDVTLELSRLHALIGPNDSGKSTVLHAIRIVAELARMGPNFHMDRPDRRVLHPSTMISLQWGTTAITYSSAEGRRLLSTPQSSSQIDPAMAATSAAPVYGAHLIRWDPDAIRRSSELIPETDVLTLGERGERLPAVYDSLLSRDRDAFVAIEGELRMLFPTVRGIWLPALNSSEKALGVVLADGTKVHADEMSEGLLYWLAFAILPHVSPTAILLIEEPENGLHPARIADVVKVLRQISRRTQVILATHSPLVINELAPTEVTILTRDPDRGTQATRLDRTKNFQQRQQVYALGELWLSYADGIDEAALVKGADRGEGDEQHDQGVPRR